MRKTFPAEPSARRLSIILSLPAMILMALVLAYPIAFSGYLAFHEVGLKQLRSGTFDFIGFANFAELSTDRVFWKTLRNTFVFVFLSVLLEVVLGLMIAVTINQKGIWLSRVSRVILLLPWAIPPVVNGLLWGFIFNTQFGYLNRILISLGVIERGINWLGDPTLAMGVVIAAYVWRTLPFNVLLYYAALQGIPNQLYEAAEISGLNAWQRFTEITLQLLRPVITVSLILRTSFAFMVFDEIFVITQGGPGNATWVAAWYTYTTSFDQPFEFGLGAASAYVLSLIMLVISVIYVRTVYRRVS